MKREIHCLLCGAHGMKTLSGFTQTLPDGWIHLQATNAPNREAHVCGLCAQKVPATPNLLASVG